MKTRIIPAAAAALLLLAAGLALVSCPASIYFTLENEKKTIDNTLNNEISFFDVATLNPGAGVGPYYAAGGSIWKGTVSGTTSTWETAKVSPPQPGMLCNGLVAFGTELYGSFFPANGSTLPGLFVTTGGGAAFSSTSIADTDIQDRQISLVRVIPTSQIVAVTATGSGDPFTYSTWGSADGSSFTRVLADRTVAVTGVTRTSDNTYWVATGTELWSGLTEPTMAKYTGGSFAIEAGDELRDVFADGNRLIVSSKLGAVYYWANATVPSWTKVSAPNVGDKTVGFLGIAGPTPGNADKYLVGADGYGYYTLDVAAGTLTRFDVSTIALYASAVRGFLIDGSTVFAETLSKGLWRTSFTAGAPGDWIQE